MRMRAISNGDTILVMGDPQYCCVGSDRAAATFHPDSNTVEVRSNCSGHLDEILGALRKYRQERGLPAVSMKVEYW